MWWWHVATKICCNASLLIYRGLIQFFPTLLILHSKYYTFIRIFVLNRLLFVYASLAFLFVFCHCQLTLETRAISNFQIYYWVTTDTIHSVFFFVRYHKIQIYKYISYTSIKCRSSHYKGYKYQSSLEVLDIKTFIYF